MDGYEFKRCDGSEGSVSQRLKDTQKFVDTHFPSCLMCGTDNPYWKLASVETFFGGSTMFRCDKCGGVFQGSNGDLTDGPVDSKTAMFNNMAKTASDLDKNKKFIREISCGFIEFYPKMN